MPNKDIFAELIQRTFTLELPSGIKVEVRRLPFATAMRLLAELAHVIHASALTSTAADNVSAFAKKVSAPELSDADRGQVVLDKLMPLILDLASAAPDITKSVLRDVLPDATDDVLTVLTLEDALCVIGGVFEHADKAVIAKQVKQIFFGVTGVLKMAGQTAQAK